MAYLHIMMMEYKWVHEMSTFFSNWFTQNNDMNQILKIKDLAEIKKSSSHQVSEQTFQKILYNYLRK